LLLFETTAATTVNNVTVNQRINSDNHAVGHRVVNSVDHLSILAVSNLRQKLCQQPKHVHLVVIFHSIYFTRLQEIAHSSHAARLFLAGAPCNFSAASGRQ
jgi:hypothetical protein